MNIAEALLNADPTAVAVRGFEGERTYGQLIGAVAASAAVIRERGIVAGDRVAIVMPNSAAHIAAYYAIACVGGVVVSINPRSTVNEIEAAVRLTRPRVIIVADGLAETVTRVVSALPVPPAMIRDVEMVVPIEPAENQQDEFVGRLASQPASILFTSGSTGAPKGVVLSHGNVDFAARTQSATMGATADDALLLAAPLHHCYGQNAVLHTATVSGSSVVLTDPRRTRNLVEDLAAYSVTALPAVPALFRVLLDLGANRAQLPELRWAMAAASALPPSIAQRWLDSFGFELHEGYGLTETSPCAFYNDHVASAAGSLGRPFRGVNVRLVDDEDADVAPGQTGELLISGPNVMSGYFEDPVATAEAIRDNWLHTGDLVRLDINGDYWVDGRSKNLIIVSGANVFPAEVEAVLTSHPAVTAAVVVGVPHSVSGEAVVAFVQLVDGAHDAEAVNELRERCRSWLSPHKRPVVIRTLDTIPDLSSGKPDVRRLRDMARGPT